MEKKIVLNLKNAPNVSTIVSIAHPEWGVKRFFYNEQPLPEGKAASCFGNSTAEAVLFEDEYKFWYVNSVK